jgi:hypothetical protein
VLIIQKIVLIIQKIVLIIQKIVSTIQKIVSTIPKRRRALAPAGLVPAVAKHGKSVTWTNVKPLLKKRKRRRPPFALAAELAMTCLTDPLITSRLGLLKLVMVSCASNTQTACLTFDVISVVTSAKTELTSPVTLQIVTSAKTELTSPVTLQAFASDACSGQGPAVGEGGSCRALTTASLRNADPLPKGKCPTRPETTESASSSSQRLLKRGRRPPQKKRKKKRMRSVTRNMKSEEE